MAHCHRLDCEDIGASPLKEEKGEEAATKVVVNDREEGEEIRGKGGEGYNYSFKKS